MKKIICTLATLFLFACQPAPTPVVISTPTPIPSPVVTPIMVPGYGIKTQWKWTASGIPSDKLKTLSSGFKTPRDISLWLFANHEWDDTYDYTEFISPNQFADGHKSVCTGFARFWIYNLAQQGVHADFVTMYGPNFAHAVAVFRSPIDGRYHMGSNQSYYGDANQDLDKNNEGRDNAIINSAKFFLNDSWNTIEVYDENGRIIETKTNSKVPGSNVPGSNSKVLFSYRY